MDAILLFNHIDNAQPNHQHITDKEQPKFTSQREQADELVLNTVVQPTVNPNLGIHTAADAENQQTPRCARLPPARAESIYKGGGLSAKQQTHTLGAPDCAGFV